MHRKYCYLAAFVTSQSSELSLLASDDWSPAESEFNDGIWRITGFVLPLWLEKVNLPSLKHSLAWLFTWINPELFLSTFWVLLVASLLCCLLPGLLDVARVTVFATSRSPSLLPIPPSDASFLLNLGWPVLHSFFTRIPP